MIGFDMSWASFHVLEVMSSAKYRQKRVGYLGAMQSFRSDTDVLVLATNQIKKVSFWFYYTPPILLSAQCETNCEGANLQDLGATAVPTMTLPITTLPHILSSSLAMSTQTDLLPRLSHSNSNVRKKAIVTLYRMALVYPETLVAAWPKIKDRLMDKNEDASVTSAIVSVICELGWRRPHDFLPLAPRLFELLVDSGNNWMAIKLIKLVCLCVWPVTGSCSNIYVCVVCYSDTTGAEIGTQATAATDGDYSHNTSHVASVRVYQRHHPRRHSRQRRRRLRP